MTAAIEREAEWQETYDTTLQCCREDVAAAIELEHACGDGCPGTLPEDIE